MWKSVYLICLLVCCGVLAMGLEEANEAATLDATVTNEGIPVHRKLRRRRQKTIEEMFAHPEHLDPHYVQTSEWWDVEQRYLNNFKENREWDTTLSLRRYQFENNKIHSCYQYRYYNNTVSSRVLVKENTFCFPALMITGVPKCSTSALYQLIRRFDNVRTLLAKEVCMQSFFYASIHNYFDALSFVPNDGSLDPSSVILTACILLRDNLDLRYILREPNTFYIVVVRDYADWLWSSYNYWCHKTMEADCTHDTHWANKEYHHRSPESFHALVTNTSRYGNDSTRSLFFTQPIELIFEADVCAAAQHMFRQYMLHLWSAVSPENTAIYASEDLESNVERVVDDLIFRIGFPHGTSGANLEHFKSVRYNTNSHVSPRIQLYSYIFSISS